MVRDWYQYSTRKRENEEEEEGEEEDIISLLLLYNLEHCVDIILGGLSL